MLKNVLHICFVCIVNGILASGQYVDKMPTKWSTNILQDRVSVIALKTIEPGFDLTDEEIKKFKLWPRGIISYYIDDFSFDKVLRDRVRNFLDTFGGLTGLHFLELPNPPLDANTRWILFVNRRGLLGCADHNAMNFTNEGVQKVVLGYDCICNGGELAEVGLAIAGVPPQHNSPDRDNYISVHMEKILPGKQYLFKKLQDSDWLFHDVEYDFTSVSHYHFHKHSIDGTATIVPKKPVDVPVGEGDGLSYTDVLKVRMLYNYISKKKFSGAKAPDCNKLFKPGSNFDKYQPREDDTEPRPKPKKYLGLAHSDNIPVNSKNNQANIEKLVSEEEITNDDNEREHAIVKVDDNPDDFEDREKDKGDNNVVTVSTRNPDGSIETLKGDPNDHDEKATDNQVVVMHTKSQKLKSLKSDPFLVLSDYESGPVQLKRTYTRPRPSIKTTYHKTNNRHTRKPLYHHPIIRK